MSGDYDWRWEVRRDYCVLVNPSGGDQLRVHRKNQYLHDALEVHAARWGKLDVSTKISGTQAGDLMKLLDPIATPFRKKRA